MAGRAPWLYLRGMTHSSISEDSIRELVSRFYGKARLDAELGPVFQAAVADWAHHLDHIAEFWMSTLLGTRRFSGNPMAAHRRWPITPGMFDRWLALWGETAKEIFSPEDAAMLQARAERIAESLKLGLFYKPAEVERSRA